MSFSRREHTIQYSKRLNKTIIAINDFNILSVLKLFLEFVINIAAIGVFILLSVHV